MPSSTNQGKLYQKIIISIANIALLHVRFAKILRENLIDLVFITFYSSIKTQRIQLLSSQGYYLQIHLFSESAKQQKFLGDIMKQGFHDNQIQYLTTHLFILCQYAIRTPTRVYQWYSNVRICCQTIIFLPSSKCIGQISSVILYVPSKRICSCSTIWFVTLIQVLGLECWWDETKIKFIIKLESH